jgi:hypothetical protein
MLITAKRESMEHRPRRSDGMGTRGVDEGETPKEASAYPSEQLGITSSLGACHSIDGRPSNWGWYGATRCGCRSW